jgi:hypothetical protein
MRQALALVVAMAGLSCLQPHRSMADDKGKDTKSIVGTWKVKSFKIDGKESNGPLAAWKTGAVWKFKKGGKGQMGGDEITRWSYDAEDAEFSTYGKSFGFELSYFEKATVKWIEKDVRLKFSKLGSNYEVVLTPDD